MSYFGICEHCTCVVESRNGGCGGCRTVDCVTEIASERTIGDKTFYTLVDGHVYEGDESMGERLFDDPPKGLTLDINRPGLRVCNQCVKLTDCDFCSDRCEDEFFAEMTKQEERKENY